MGLRRPEPQGPRPQVPQASQARTVSPNPWPSGRHGRRYEDLRPALQRGLGSPRGPLGAASLGPGTRAAKRFHSQPSLAPWPRSSKCNASRKTKTAVTVPDYLKSNETNVRRVDLFRFHRGQPLEELRRPLPSRLVLKEGFPRRDWTSWRQGRRSIASGRWLRYTRAAKVRLRPCNRAWGLVECWPNACRCLTPRFVPMRVCAESNNLLMPWQSANLVYSALIVPRRHTHRGI